MASNINPDWQAVRDLTAVSRRESEATTSAAIAAVPVIDDPSGPAILSPLGVIGRMLVHFLDEATAADAFAAIHNDAELIAWRQYVNPPIGD